MVFLKYISVLNLVQIVTQITIKDHSWHVQDFYQANQLEIKSNKNLTQAFYFELKVWPQLEINETRIFSQTNSLWNNIGGICS